jgi:transposase
LHKFSRKMVDRYQHIVVGDVSSQKLVKTRMAKSVLDSGWGTLKRFLAYKCEHAARSFEVRAERYSTVTCSHCRALSGPRGVNGLIVDHGSVATVERCTTETLIRLRTT